MMEGILKVTPEKSIVSNLEQIKIHLLAPRLKISQGK